jgi:hypothetical protein
VAEALEQFTNGGEGERQQVKQLPEDTASLEDSTIRSSELHIVQNSDSIILNRSGSYIIRIQ